MEIQHWSPAPWPLLHNEAIHNHLTECFPNRQHKHTKVQKSSNVLITAYFLECGEHAFISKTNFALVVNKNCTLCFVKDQMGLKFVVAPFLHL